MKAFSIPKAAFAGFALLGRNPLAVLAWWVLCTAFLIGVGVMGAAMAGEAMAALEEMQTSGQMDITSYMEVSSETTAYTVISTILQTVFGVMITSAVLRAFMRPAEKGFAYLRIGMQEWRLFLVGLVLMIIMGLAFAVVFAIGAIGGAILLATGSRAIGGVVIIATAVLTGGLMIFLNIRFLFASPQTVHERAIRMFESWKLTGGKTFVPLLGAFLLFFLVLLLFAALFLGAAGYLAYTMDGVSSLGAMIPYLTQPAYTVEAALTPARLIACVLVGLLWVFSSVLGLGMASSAFSQVTGAEPDSMAKVFSDGADDDEDWDDE